MTSFFASDFFAKFLFKTCWDTWYLTERRVSASSVPLEPRIKELENDNEQLKSENNLLKLKVELLLDMLAQKTAEADFLFEDMEKMRKILVKTHPPARKS